VPTLNWIGKEAVMKHHKEVSFRLVEPEPELSCGEIDSGNLIVQGDNLSALKALLPRYAGQVKCIYIDPPYNTGNEGWVYNDNVNSPEIRKWLGEVVGKEGETLDRHDRWLCMMYPRLVLLKQFLREDGAIFISIDDNEVATLRLLMDEIFGAQNFVSAVSWIKRVSPANDAKFLSSDTEFVVIYAKLLKSWNLNRLPRTQEQLSNYTNPDLDPRGAWNSVTYTCNKSADERPNLYYGITNPTTGEKIWPKKTAVWKFSEETYKKHSEEDQLWWGKQGTSKQPRLKRFLSNMGDVVPRSFWKYEDCGHTQEARSQLLDIVHECPFITPKPTRLIQRILQIATDKDSLILDSFAGSGTTGHAVLNQNAEDGGNRRFILVEMDESIARNITAERVRRVCEGYTNGKGKEVAGLGGSFQFCCLSNEPLFQADGPIRTDVTFAQLAEFVWFMETGTGLAQSALLKRKKPTPFLGKYKACAVFLLYNGILKDKSDPGGNVLNSRTLDVLHEALPDFDGPRVVYGARSRFDKQKLAKLGITFHQLPYELAVKTWF